MPFTFSHPAIILPLIKLGEKRISATALVAGSMAPDFEYFIQMEMRQVHGHTLPGIFYFDLPLTLIICFIFHLAVRDALILHAPQVIQQKFKHFVGYSWKKRFRSHWPVILISALLGIASHLFWDSFTHANRFFVNHIPFLQEQSDFFGVTLYHHDVAQLASSLIGGLGILAVLIIPFNQRFNLKLFLTKMMYWGFVGLILIIVLIIRNGNSIGDFIATFISGGLIGMILTPFCIKWLKN
ncbi:MAG: DUF4184 family protein [Crocinitomicaceae bacterium]